MAELFQRLWAWLHTHEGKKIVRYLTVSVITTGVSVGVLGLVYGVFGWWSEVPSTIFANAVATFPSYWLNRNWAWGKSGRSHLTREVIPFWVVAAAGIAFSMIGASVVGHFGQTHHLPHAVQTVLVMAANVVSFGIFWILKLLLFNRLFHVPALMEEIDEHLDMEEHPTAPLAAEANPEGAGVR